MTLGLMPGLNLISFSSLSLSTTKTTPTSNAFIASRSDSVSLLS